MKPPLRVECSGRLEGGVLEFKGKHKDIEWTGQVRDRRMKAGGGEALAFKGRFKSRSSKTLGARPHERAVVLLPFTGEPPSLAEWTNQTWTPMPDGSMQVGRGSTRS